MGTENNMDKALDEIENKVTDTVEIKDNTEASDKKKKELSEEEERKVVVRILEESKVEYNNIEIHKDKHILLRILFIVLICIFLVFIAKTFKKTGELIDSYSVESQEVDEADEIEVIHSVQDLDKE